MIKIFELLKQKEENIVPPSPNGIKSKFLKTLARDFFALERGAGAARACEEQDLRYITAEHGEDARLWQMRGQKPAFTLAEVLITLAVIGIVAALTIGIFLPKIHSTIRARQIATAEVKFTKAMEQMALNNAIGPYYETTQEFVDELQNYLKVSKVCKNNELEDCFGYEKINADNEEYEIKKLTNGKLDFGMTADGTDYKETIGIVTIDGASMLLSWDKNCPILEPKVYPWSDNTNETTSCVAMIMDINSDKSPNTLNKDVALFRANRIGELCGMKFTVNGTKYCFGAPFTPIALTADDCAQNKTTYGIKNCIEGEYSNLDYWGGAMKKCQSEGKKLLSGQELAALATYLYGTNVTYDDDTWSNTNANMNATTLESLSSSLSSIYTSNSNWFQIWSNVETTNSNAWYRFFVETGTGVSNCGRYSTNFLAICTK